MKDTIIVLGLLAAFTVSAVAQDDRPARPERPDPAVVAKKMITDFDADKSGALNKEELSKALTSMRENRPQGPQQGRPGARAERPEGQERPQRPQQGDRQNPADMFMERNDSDKNGELNAGELESALKNMNRGRPDGQQERPQGQRQAPPRGDR